MRYTVMKWALPALILPLAFGACNDGDDGVGVPGTDEALVSLYLTDAPGDVEAVWVQIDHVYLQGSDGPVTLLDEPTDLIELTALVGVAQALVDDVEIPEGVYSQLRMVLGGAVLEAKDGTVYTMGGAEHPDGFQAGGELMCPSCDQSGLKALLPGGAVTVEEGSTALVLDFDVARSFGHRAGRSGKWIMRPVIHTMAMRDGPGSGRAIEGTVALADGVGIPECPAGTARSLEDFIPTATSLTLVDGEGEPIVRSGATDASGAFTVGFVPGGEWSMGWVESLDLTDWTLTFDATVEPGLVEVEGGSDVEGVLYTITGASCDAVDG